MEQARAYRLGDEIAINKAFKEVFQSSRSLEEWAWKFPRSHEGRATTLVERQGEVHGHCAGIPVQFQLDGQLVKIFNIVDVFGRSGEDTQAAVAEFFESHTTKAQHVFARWFSAGEQDTSVGNEIAAPRPVTILRRERGAGQRSLSRRLYRAELAPDWEPRLHTLWQNVGRHYPVSMVRDAEYALTRFAGHPQVTYHRFLIFPRFSARPVAWVVFRIDAGCCWWVDLLWDHQSQGALALASVLSNRLCEQTGAESEGLWLHGDPQGLDELMHLGFRRDPDDDGLCLAVRRFDQNFDVGLLENRAYITMADSDLI